MTNEQIGQSSHLRAHLQVLAGATIVERIEHSAPLKLARAFPQRDGSLNVCIMDASPGLLSGDNYHFDWHFAPNARALITTQGFTRVHPSRGQTSTQTTHLHLAAGARCKYLPLPTIPFAGADFGSKTTIELSATASLFWAETWCAGRIARGERWQFERVVSSVTVTRESEIIWCNRNRIEPQKRAASTCGAWETWTHAATFAAFVANNENQSAMVELAREIIARAGWHGGVSALDDGVAGVILGTRGEAMHEVLQVLAGALVG